MDKNNEHWLQEPYHTEKKQLLLRTAFQTAQPFPHLIIPDLFTEEKLIPVVQAIQQLSFFPKAADLFQFKQSKDFSGIRQPLLQEFRDVLRSSEFMAFIEEITGLRLKKGVIDVAASLYQDTDFLLCHDDRLENRALAFILYFSTLTKDQGGALCFYDAQEKLAKKIVPKWNTLVLFQMSKRSLHAVEEVIDANRLAVGGWYHGR